MIPRVVYTYWEGPRPPVIDFCLQTIVERAGVEVNVLTAETADREVGDLLNPNYRKITGIAQKVDLIRLAVLYRHGGMWCDADTIVLKSMAGLFDTHHPFVGMRWANTQRLLNGYFLCEPSSRFLATAMNLANDDLRAGRNYYNSASGCYFGEDLFVRAKKRLGVVVPLMDLDTMLPVRFPESVGIFETNAAIVEYLTDRTVAVGLNHSQMSAPIKRATVGDIEKMPNLIGSVLRFYKYGPADVWLLDRPWDNAVYEKGKRYRPVENRLAGKRNAARQKKITVSTTAQKPERRHPGQLAIFAVADADYAPLLPLWALCARRACPDCDLHVITRNCDAPAGVAAACRRRDDDLLNDGRVAASLRFLVGDDALSRYDYCLITDADILMYPETMHIADQHAEAMILDDTGCYENWLLEYIGADPRLLGVHFVTKGWWKITEQARQRELEALGAVSAPGYNYDEVMLGRIVRDSQLRLPPPKVKMWRHHGIHLGPLRRTKNATQRISAHESLLLSWLLHDEAAKKVVEQTVAALPDLKRLFGAWRVALG